MSVVNRFSSDGQGLMMVESAYGTAPTGSLAAATVLMDCQIEMKYNPIVKDTNIHTDSRFVKDVDKVITGSSVNVTVKGNLCKEHEIF